MRTLEACLRSFSRFASRSWVSLVLLLLSISGPAIATDFYVSPAGTTSTAVGTGTITNPWALQTALSQPSAVKPGDTIWLRGGTYVGIFTSYLNGTSNNPIHVKQYPGERATLDGNLNNSQSGSSLSVLTLDMSSSYTWYWNFEVMNSSTVRTDNYPCVLCRGEGVSMFAPGSKLINLVVHDTGQGIGNWSFSTNAEIYGNIVYYNGWVATTGQLGAHGHGLYAQNPAGSTKIIKHNLMFSGLGDWNFQAYGSDAAAFLNTTFQENVWWRQSNLDGTRQAGSSLIGGHGAFDISNSGYLNNYSWDSTQKIGYYSTIANGTFVTGNYFCNLSNSSVFTGPYSVPLNTIGVTGNTFVGGLDNTQQSDYPNNTYYANNPPGSVGNKPTTNKIVVLPNAYEANRGTIVVYNWQGLSSVSVDVSGFLAVGTAYQVRDAQNFYGPLVASGTYSGGTITLPMTALTPATPVGYPVPPPTGPAFNVFIVLSGSSGPPDAATSPTSNTPAVSRQRSTPPIR